MQCATIKISNPFYLKTQFLQHRKQSSFWL